MGADEPPSIWLPSGWSGGSRASRLGWKGIGRGR
uniref:Uncharacterized protein n=1 Tax=Arundo donax TaxID=35708 RepID=A0A0A9U684_ARUDO